MLKLMLSRSIPGPLLLCGRQDGCGMLTVRVQLLLCSRFAAGTPRFVVR